MASTITIVLEMTQGAGQINSSVHILSRNQIEPMIFFLTEHKNVLKITISI